MRNKLELTWFNKNKEDIIEPRTLVENPQLSYVLSNGEHNLFSIDKRFDDNILIHGDNLLGLKSLESKYSGSVKCIYIDPPYNTGSAFEHYEDNLEHSIWLSLMKSRLQILRKLLRNDGLIFIQIDDAEQAYLKVICDEIFGRKNFVNMIIIKAKASSGASGGGEDRRLKKNVEYILVYSKTDEFKKFKPVYKRTSLESYIYTRKLEKKNFAYKSVMLDPGEMQYVGEIKAGNGQPIKIFKHINSKIQTVSSIAKRLNIDEYKVYEKYIHSIFTLENAQTSIRTRVIDYVGKADEFYTARYIPVSGRNKGKITDVQFIGKTKRLVSYLDKLVDIEGKEIYKKDKVGTLWDDISWSSVHIEGDVRFPNGKKPELLLERIIRMSTDEGDLVLDSFLGSGTTIATAHKMKRKWIGIEFGDQIYSHCKPRIDSVIDGKDKTGISDLVKWDQGGGYKFYELAPSLIKFDAFNQPIINKEYNPNMIASAVALHEGYTYNPNQEVYWKQSFNGEKSYLFVTTNHLNKELLYRIHDDMKEDEYLMIVCKSFSSNLEYDFKSITIKKIPQSLLKNCEFDVDNYNLNIVNPPVYEEGDEE